MSTDTNEPIVPITDYDFVDPSTPLYRNHFCIEVSKIRTGDGVILAMKTLKLSCEAEELDASAVCDDEKHRIEQEIETLKCLRHPNVLRFFEVQRVPPATFHIFMEFVDGRTIAEALEGGRKFSDRELKLIVKDMCSGLSYLHNQRPPIVHCDVQGRNVMINDACGAKLIDFGVSVRLAMLGSRAASAHYTNSLRHSSEAFVAPELVYVTQRRYSPESDVWSLGCTLYQMLTGCTPYEELRQVLKISNMISKHGAPKLPEESDWLTKDFYKLCVKFEPRERAKSVTLLQHPFLAGVHADA